MSGLTPELVAERVGQVRDRIAAAGGDPAQVRLVAVTKGFGPDAVRSALGAGIEMLGENYADELVAKAEAVGPGGYPASPFHLEWHFLGPIQRNKLARLAPHVGCYQAVDRLVEAQAIAARAPGARVLIEVDTTGMAQRPGVAPGEVAQLLAQMGALAIEVAGLMTVAPPGGGDPARRAFRTVGRLAGELGLGEVSMGMSDDLELAVAEGATMVRVGRSLFGPRPELGELAQ